ASALPLFAPADKDPGNRRAVRRHPPSHRQLCAPRRAARRLARRQGAMVFARTHLRHGKRRGAPAAAADHRQGARRTAANSASRTGVKNTSLPLVGRLGWGSGGLALSLTLALDL